MFYYYLASDGLHFKDYNSLDSAWHLYKGKLKTEALATKLELKQIMSINLLQPIYIYCVWILTLIQQLNFDLISRSYGQWPNHLTHWNTSRRNSKKIILHLHLITPFTHNAFCCIVPYWWASHGKARWNSKYIVTTSKIINCKWLENKYFNEWPQLEYLFLFTYTSI